MNWERDQLFPVVAVFAILPLFLFDNLYYSRVFTILLIYAVMAMAMNIAFGHTNQLFLFNGALMGTGAYFTYLAGMALGISPWLTLVPGALIAGAFGYAVCYVAARRRITIIVLAILTLSLQLAFIQLVAGARTITGGHTGQPVSGLGLPQVQHALGLGANTVLFYVALVVFLCVGLLYYYLTNSTYGIAFDTIRQDEVAAAASGVDVVRQKAVAGFVSAFVIGFIGPFYVQINGYLIPSDFHFAAVDVLLLIMVILGGLRTMLGPVIGAVILTYVNETIQSTGQWGPVILGFLLMVLFLFFRQGIVPAVRDVVVDRRGRTRAESGPGSG